MSIYKALRETDRQTDAERDRDRQTQRDAERERTIHRTCLQPLKGEENVQIQNTQTNPLNGGLVSVCTRLKQSLNV